LWTIPKRRVSDRGREFGCTPTPADLGETV
jgi:hypothetical protein